MFVVTRRLVYSVRSEVGRHQPAHGTPDGVRASRVSVAINMRLLTEFLRRTISNVKLPESAMQVLQEIHLSEKLSSLFCLVLSDHQPCGHRKRNQPVSGFAMKVIVDTGVIECSLDERDASFAGDGHYFDEFVELGLRFRRQLIDECDLAIIANLEAFPVFSSAFWTEHIFMVVARARRGSRLVHRPRGLTAQRSAASRASNLLRVRTKTRTSDWTLQPINCHDRVSAKWRRVLHGHRSN
jgi:hypothetical protein